MSFANDILWCEKYRPSTIEECILPDTMKSTFQAFVDRKEIPNLMLCGTAGIGKTTVARALCSEVGCDYLMMNGSETRGIDDIRNKVKNYATSVSLLGGRKVIIIDESDNLTPDAQSALRAMIEEVSSNCSFIFTCNYKHRIIDPIHSRCTVIDFKMNGSKAKMATQFFKRVLQILQSENIEYSNDVVAEIVKKHFPDNRRVLNELQRYSAGGSIDVGVLSSVTEVQIKDLINSLKTKNYSECRKWVVNNLDQESSTMFRSLYDNLNDHLEPNSIPQLVLILSKYQYQAAFVADPEINILACLTEIMVDCNFR